MAGIWQWILAHWVTVGGLGGLLAIIFAFWGRIMAFLEAWWKAQETRARAREARVRADKAEAEIKTAEQSEEIRKLARQVRQFVDRSGSGPKVWKKEGFLGLVGNDWNKLEEVFEYLEREGHAKKTVLRDLWRIG